MANNEGTPLHGDRSAWNTTDHADEHARDIDDSALLRHLPAPASDGNFAVDDGSNWVAEGGSTVRASLGLVAGGAGDIWVEKTGDTITGPIVFEGTGSGLAYGGMYQHEASTVVDLVLDNWVQVGGWTSVGLLNNVSFVASDALTVDVVGVYKLSWSMNGDTVGGNKDLRFVIFLNDAEVAQGSGRTHSRAAGEEFQIAANCILDITDTAHEVDIRIMNLTDSTDITIHGATFNLIQLGGT